MGAPEKLTKAGKFANMKPKDISIDIDGLLKRKHKMTKTKIADNIIEQLQSNGLTKDQIDSLKDTLKQTLDTYEEQNNDDKTKTMQDKNLEVVEAFVRSKKIQNCSHTTLYNYGRESQRLLEYTNKPYYEVTTDDVRKYLDYRKEHDKVSNTTIHNCRIYLLAFFKYLKIEDKIRKNPMDNIGPVKIEKKVVEYLTDEELEMIRCACTSERDLAIVDILAGSGMRCGELCGLNREDVDLEAGEMKVYGKGQKERICYLTGRAKVHLRWYLESRTDKNPALFVSAKKPFTRLTRSSVEFILKEIGQRSAIPDVRIYPHKFRKTLATQMINRGADIDQVRRILGHTDRLLFMLSKDAFRKAMRVVHKLLTVRAE